MPDFYPLLRPLLFLLPPERAHTLTLALLRNPLVAAILSDSKHDRSSSTASPALPGLALRNRIGLAAGADKNALALAGWHALGFGFIEVGTVTPRPQPGNPQPRLWRFPRKRALINALGFPNDGADTVAARLRAWRQKHPCGTGMLIGVNCGKQKDTPLLRATDDYLQVIEKCLSCADFIVINVSSPNTPGLRLLQTADTIYPILREVVQACATKTNSANRNVPVWVKISPDQDYTALVETADAILRAGAHAVVATNTTLDHSPLASELRGRSLPGGLSGEPLIERTLQCIKKLHEHFGTRLPIVACGGISRSQHATACIDSGATLLEIYTALIYRGPGLISKLIQT